MNEIMDGLPGVTSTAMIMLLVIIGMFVWFFVNRASVRADKQVQLLNALLEEQKRQNALLKKLADSLTEEEESESQAVEEAENGFIRMIPER